MSKKNQTNNEELKNLYKREEEKTRKRIVAELKEFNDDLNDTVKTNQNCTESAMDRLSNGVEGTVKTIGVRVENRADKLQSKIIFALFLEVVIIILILYFSITISMDVYKIKEIQAEQGTQLEEMSVRMEGLSMIATSEENESTFLDTIFGNNYGYYYDNNENKFYYDPDCKMPIFGEVYFKCKTAVDGEDSKGRKVNCFRTIHDDICYAPYDSDVEMMSW